jgi:hypothetical protein
MPRVGGIKRPTQQTNTDPNIGRKMHQNLSNNAKNMGITA